MIFADLQGIFGYSCKNGDITRRAHATLRCDGVRVGRGFGDSTGECLLGNDGSSYFRVLGSSDCYSSTIWTVLPHAPFKTMHVPFTADSSWPFAEDGTSDSK